MQSNLPLIASIFFDAPSSSDQPFPLASDLPSYHEVPSQLRHFLLVASDPTRKRYFDEADEAMDTTNWSVVANWVPSSTVPTLRYFDDEDEVAEAIEVGAFFFYDTFDSYLLVDPAHEASEEMIDAFEGLRSALEDYPLLDEEAYSMLEEESFWNFVRDGGMQSDVTSDLKRGGVDEETIDAIDEAWVEIAEVAASNLDYYNGFEASCSPPFEEAIAMTIVKALILVAS